MSPSPISKAKSSQASSTGWGTPNCIPSEDFPMSDPCSTSPKLVNPVFYSNDPNTASPYFIHPNYLSPLPLSQDQSCPYSMNQNPLETSQISYSNDLNPLISQVTNSSEIPISSVNQDLYNPLLLSQVSANSSSHIISHNQDSYNPLLPPQSSIASFSSSLLYGSSTSPENPLLPDTSSSTFPNPDLYNPLLTGASCSTLPNPELYNPLLPGASSSTLPNPELYNPLLLAPWPSCGSAEDNRSPISGQVAGHSRPVAPSARRHVEPTHLNYGSAGCDIGGSPTDAMSRPGASPPDVQRSPTHQDTTPEDPQQLYVILNEYLLLENKFQPRLCLPAESDKVEVTLGARSGAAHVLRWLAVWFDLPPSVFFEAISLLDRFLTKMRVRPCHVACITVSCMKVALERVEDAPPVTAKELVSVSQSGCTAGDVTRMSGVICDKLEVAGGSVTALHWLRLLRRIVVCAAKQLGLPPLCQEDVLVKQLEIVVCDPACATARLSEMALVLIFHSIGILVVLFCINCMSAHLPMLWKMSTSAISLSLAVAHAGSHTTISSCFTRTSSWNKHYWEDVLVKQLEIVVCDPACATARLSEMALVLIFHSIEQQMVEWSAAGLMTENAYYLYELGAQLQQHCRMSESSLNACGQSVRAALSRYEASARAPHRQRCVWRLSTRTLKVLRPTERLTSVLPTIEEQHHNDAAPRTPNRNRSGSESSENEETSDWPRSPVLPVYCEN